MAEGGPTLSRNILPPNIEAGDEFALRSSSATSGDLDFIAAYEAWRKQCPDYKKLWHGGFCERCDMLAWQIPTGGVTYNLPGGIADSGSYFAQTEDKSLADVGEAAKINEHGQSSYRHEFEEPHMSDYIRDILRMSGGGNLSGRGNFSVPEELMNALAGDEAQEALAKERLLNEMKKQDVAKHDPRFVTIQLMEMEKHDVDGFLKHARAKIIKRGKPGRKGCCVRIGGVLDNVLGPAGGEDTLKDVKPEDQGKKEPLGKAESLDASLAKFIAEEFGLREHSSDCELRAHLEKGLSEQEKFVQGAVKRPSALRQHYGLREGEQIPVGKAQAEFDALQQKVHDDVALSEDETKLLRRLQFFLTVVKPALAEATAGDLTLKTRPDNKAFNTEPAKLAAGKNKTAGEPTKAKVRTAKKALGEALSSFTEATAGDLTLKKRTDNSAFPTELTTVNGGNKGKVAGKPSPLKTRGVKPVEPLGKAEDADDDAEVVAEAGPIASGALRKVGMGLGRQSLVGRGLMGGKGGMAAAAKRIAALPKSKQLQMGQQALGALGIQAQSADSHLDAALSSFTEAHKEGASAASPSKKPYTAEPSKRSDNTDAGVKTGLSKGPAKRGVKPNDPIGGKK